MRDKDQAGCSKIRKPFLDVWTRENSNRAKPRRPSMSVFSAIFVLKENGTQSHSARFLNWGDHVNSVPDLAACPRCFGKREIFSLFSPTLLHGSYIFRKTNFKDFSRIFQGQITVFKDYDLFNKQALFNPLLNTLLAKKRYGVIYDFYFLQPWLITLFNLQLSVTRLCKMTGYDLQLRLRYRKSI